MPRVVCLSSAYCVIRPKLYGDGRNVCDWIHTEDHGSAAWARPTFFCADGERDNITVMRNILRAIGQSENTFDWARVRPGHDRRCAIDSSKLRAELCWRPRNTNFTEGLAAAIAWYADNETWRHPVKDATKTK